jgi:uncharacterized protein
MKSNVAKPYINPYLGGLLLGVVLFLSFFLTGNGLGASGALNRIIVSVEDIFASSHIDAVPYLAKMAGGDVNPLNHWLIPLVLGTIFGGFLSALLNKRFKVETNKGPRISKRNRWILAFIGGAIMGYGARFARGCTSGQALSGGSVLSVGSWSFMIAVFVGAYAMAWFFRKQWMA